MKNKLDHNSAGTRFVTALSLCAALFLFLALISPVQAIEKHKKDADTTKVDTVAAPKQPLPKPQPPVPKDTIRVHPKIKLAPTFNDFIDANRNGVDDRIEQGGYFVPPKKTTTPKPLPAKQDTVTTPPPAQKTNSTQKKDK